MMSTPRWQSVRLDAGLIKLPKCLQKLLQNMHSSFYINRTILRVQKSTIFGASFVSDFLPNLVTLMPIDL